MTNEDRRDVVAMSFRRRPYKTVESSHKSPPLHASSVRGTGGTSCAK